MSKIKSIHVKGFQMFVLGGRSPECFKPLPSHSLPYCTAQIDWTFQQACIFIDRDVGMCPPLGKTFPCEEYQRPTTPYWSWA